MFFLYQVGSSIFFNSKVACCTQEGVTPEQILAKLLHTEVSIAQGKSVPVACREPGISDVSY